MSVNIAAVNDAPVVVSPSTPVALAGINEDQGNGTTTGTNPGATVTSLFGARFSDVDAGASMSGIVVVGNGSALATGQWQYSTTANEWHDIGTVSAADGLVLSSATQLRFAPAENWFGMPGELDVKLLDNTQTTFTSGATPQKLNTSTGTAVSTGIVKLGTTVASVNDLPTISSDVTAASLTETAALDTSVATATGALTGTLAVTDVEGVASVGIRGGSGTTTVTKAGFFGTLTLDTGTKEWTYTPSNFTAINALGEGKTATDTFDFSVADTNGATASQALTITYTGTNDLPVVAAAIDDQVFNGSGAWSYQIPANTFADAEGTDLTYTVQVVDSGGAVLDTITGVTAGDANKPSNWLIFNEASRTLSGKPTTITTAGLPLNIKVTASDGNGGTVADTFTVTLNAPASAANPTPGNLAPTTTDDHLVTTGSAAVTLTINDFGSYSDANGDALALVLIVSPPPSGVNGSLTYSTDGSSWNAVTGALLITKENIDLGYLKFTPGTSPAAITFKVNDGTTYSDAQTLTVDVGTKTTAVNMDASTVTTAKASEWTSVYSDNTTVLDGYSGTVRVVVEATGGTVKLASDAGVTAITQGYAASLTVGGTSIAFEGTLGQVNAALQQLQANLATNPNMTLTVSAIKGGSAYNPQNGHYYEVVTAGASWDAANAAAATKTFNGLKGYLATITSAEENAFILSKLPSTSWIGANDAATEGTWTWISGPEAGTPIYTGGATAPGQYTNWNSDEPSNSLQGALRENYAAFFAAGAEAGKWNDVKETDAFAYIVEYSDGFAGGTVLEQASRTITLNKAPASSAPVLAIAGDANYTENAAHKALNPALALTDLDSTTLASATVTIGAGKVAGDALALTNVPGTMGNIAGVYVDGVLTLSSSGNSATLAQWTAALKAVTFASTSDNPGASRTLSWQVNDGTNASNVGTTSIAVTEVNDAPVAINVADWTVGAGQAVSLDIGNVFTDPEGQTVTYSAEYQKADGSWAAVPASAGFWLTFNPTTHIFSGNPPAGLPFLNLRVNGTDTSNAVGSTTFKLNLADATSGAAAANTLGTVSISGSTTLGATLTATAPTDADGFVPANVQYQWQMLVGSTWTDIGGATASTFVITQAQSNKQVRVQALYNDDGGFAEAPESNALTVPALNVAGVVAVLGSTTPDEVLVASLSDANGIVGVTPTYQWYRGTTEGALTTAITGATGSSYTLTLADGGKYVSVQVTYTDNETTAETVIGGTTAPITLGAYPPVAVNDANTATEAGGVANGLGGATGGSNATGNVLTNDTDENTSDTKAVAGVRTGNSEGSGEAGVLGADEFYTLSGIYGTLKVKADGSYTYTVNQTAANVQALKAGDTATDAFNYTVKDSTNKTDVGVLTITLTGADDTLEAKNLPASFAVNEDQKMALVIPSDLSLVDPDFSGDATITLVASAGTLSGASGQSVVVTGTDTATLTLVGTLAHISTWLTTAGNVQYTGAQDANGTAAATITFNGGGSALGTANVNITAVNDAPVISSNSGGETAAINYQENGTAPVTTVTATDVDAGDTQTFSISGGLDANLFRIDASTGALTFKNSPNFELPTDSDNNNSYLVTVKVTDAGGLSDEQALTVSVTDDTGPSDPIESGGTAPVTITAPVDNAQLNITGSGATTVTNPAGNLSVANNGSGTTTVSGLIANASLNASGTGPTQISDPTGSLTVANSGTGTVTVDGLNTGAALAASGTGPTALTNPDGNLSVVNSGTGTVTVSGLNPDASLSTSGTGPTQVSNPEGSLTVANTGAGTVTVDSLNVDATLTSTGTGPTSVTNPDGNLSVANSGTGTVTVSGLNPGANLNTSGTGPTQVSDPEGSLAVVNTGTGTVTVDGLNTGAVLTASGTGPTALTNPDGNLSVANSGTGTVTVAGLNPGAGLNTSGTGPTKVSDPEGSLTVANTGAGTVTVDGLNTGAVLTASGTGPTALTNPDGNLSVANSGTVTVTVSGLNPNASLNASGTGPTQISDPEGNLTVANTGTGTVTIAGLNDDAVLSSNSTGPISVLNPDDDLTVVNNGTGTVSVDGLNAGAILKTSGSGPTTVTNPDGNFSVANNGTGTVTVMQLKADAILNTTGTQPVNLDLSHLVAPQTITIDNDGTGVVNLLNVPEGVIILSTGSGTGAFNYAPTLSGVPGSAQAVTAGTAADLADFTVADRDVNHSLTVTLKATNGSISGLTDADANTAGIQLTGTASAINTALVGAKFTASAAGAASIGISVSDGMQSATSTYQLTVASTPDTSGPSDPSGPSDSNQVDGTTVTTSVTTNSEGQAVTTLVVAPVPSNRAEDGATPNAGLADIALAKDSSGAALISVGLPVGVGIESEAISADSLTLRQMLVGTSQARLGEGAALSQIIQDGIDQYLPTVVDPAQIALRTLTLKAAPDAVVAGTLAQPIVISGALGTGEASALHPHRGEALVIDVRQLPANTVLQLDNVEFAIVIGQCTVIGGSGRNFVIGDSSAQTIILGAEDDVLHGGGGNDYIGSKGGSDQLYGDAGNDTLSGGNDNDSLHGGDGNDTLYGGKDVDTAVFTGQRSQYDVTQKFGVFTVRALSGSEGTDTLVNVEHIQFADQTMEIGSKTESLSWLATLYQQVLGRQADLGGFQWWAQQADSGVGEGQVLMGFILSKERIANTGQDFNTLNTADKVEYFYNTILARPSEAAGKAWWIEQIDQNGQDLVHVAQQFMHSAELTGQYLAPKDWDFFI